MKKKIILCIIFFISLIGLFISFFTIEFTRLDKSNMTKEISNLTKEIENSKNDNKNCEEEVNILKEESISKLEELEIWEKAEKKLEQAQ